MKYQHRVLGMAFSFFPAAHSKYLQALLGDRVGPRRVLTRVVTWWSAFTTLTGTVSNYYIGGE